MVDRDTFYGSELAKNFKESLGLGDAAQQSIQASQQAVRAVGESKAKSLLENARLLRMDVGALRQTGEDVFRVQSQEARYRTASASASFLGSGVLLRGSAAQVTKNIQTQGMREALARRNQYEFQANRTQLQADIATAQAARERQAAAYEAASIQATATANVKKELASYLTRNAASYATIASKSQEAIAARIQAQENPFYGGAGVGRISINDRRTEADKINQQQYEIARQLYKDLG